jgi:hypothetical protein
MLLTLVVLRPREKSRVGTGTFFTTTAKWEGPCPDVEHLLGSPILTPVLLSGA